MLSVTIATFNRRELLRKCLEALAQQTLQRECFEIIVCDSNSTDGTDVLIHEFVKDNPDLKIRHLHTRNILAAKRNLGIESAIWENVIFFDDDCVPRQDCLKIFHDLLMRPDSGKKIFCGEVYFPVDWVNSSNYYKYRNSRHFQKTTSAFKLKLDYRTIVVMCMAFRKIEFQQAIGKVDESFIGYGCEDTELGWRLQSTGFEIVGCAAAVDHYEPSGSIEGYAKKIFHTARDGMANLLKTNPDAVMGLGPFVRIVEPDFPGVKPRVGFVLNLLRKIIFNNLIERCLTIMLTKIDSVRILYFPAFYRYVLACAYTRGAAARGRQPRVNDDWYV